MRANDTHNLESMIDQFGMIHILEALAIIAREKADHLRTNWQDEPAAKAWERASRAIDRFSTHACVVSIPGTP